MSRTVTATLLELVKRIVKFDKKLGIHNNGLDNNYPERIERLINNSSTAKPCAAIFKKFIVGKGLKELNDFVVNKETKLTLGKLLRDIVHYYSYQKGAFIHANYNLNHKVISFDTLPFKDCRVGKKDDKKYNGKIIIYDDWDLSEKKSVVKERLDIIDVFNPLENVVDAQIEKVGEIKNYKGQVFFMNPDKTVYPLAHVDNVINDCDSEFRAGVYKNTSLRKGFFGKSFVVTPPMLGELESQPDSELSDSDVVKKNHLKTERQKFRDSLKQFIGSENADGILHIETELVGDDIGKIVNFQKIESNINDKLFAYTENSSANNIRKAFDNIPSILIENSDHAIFGNSGEMLKQAKIFYQEQTEDHRTFIEETLTELMTHFEGFNMPEDGLKIVPLIEPQIQSDAIDN